MSFTMMMKVLVLLLASALFVCDVSCFTASPSITHRRLSLENTRTRVPAYLSSTTSKEQVDVLESSQKIVSQDNLSTTPNSTPPVWEGLAWRGVIGIICGLWASNFPIVKLILAEDGVDSSLYAVSRFTVAALALAPFALRKAMRDLDWQSTRDGLICGAWVAFGYLGQTLGLLTTTASRSCVICSLHCVLVAVIAESMRVSSIGRSFDVKRLVPAAIAVLGVALVELKGAGGAPTIGDALSFAQPLGFGMGYLQLEGIMRRRPDLALPISAIKLAVVALSSLCLFEITPLMHGTSMADFALQLPDLGAIFASPVALGGILYTGLITTAAAIYVESIAFAKVPATDASIILTTEPIFAAFMGAITLGEVFGTSDYVGATMIIGACIAATLMENDDNIITEEEDSMLSSKN